MLTSYAFADFRNFIKNKIWKAQYKIGSTWYDATISGIDILSSGIVRVRIPISPGAVCTITGARLISTSNQVWCEKTISVSIEDAQVNLLQWFEFNITETAS